MATTYHNSPAQKTQSQAAPRGARFTRWTVIGDPFPKRSGQSRTFLVRCRCACGTERDVSVWSLTHGKTASCGCLQREHAAQAQYIHGDAESRLYYVWKGMRERCHSSRCKAFANYGARGIQVCAEWRADYTAFRDWALTAGYQPSLTIDRKDNNGNYTPDNCRWVTRKINCRNRRKTQMVTAFGETKPLAAWAEDNRCVVSYDTLHDRLNKPQKWTPETALTTPSNSKPHKKHA